MKRVDFESHLRKRLMSNWVLVLGNPVCIDLLESNIYPPGTPENKYFEALLLSLTPPYVVVLVKKTEKLKEYLKRYGMTDEDFKKLTVIEFLDHKDKEESIVCNLKTLAPKSTKKKAIENLIAEFKSLIS